MRPNFDNELPFRQIHLDFHTSPHIPDVGISFDPEEFVKTLKEARVNSINVFAKCHHGLCYYPTKVGRMHPALKFDLLGEMLKVLHREGIKAPIYIPVGWEEVSAENLNWLEVGKDGILGHKKPFEDQYYTWRKICLNKKDYISFVLKQSQEILDMYEVDGMWYDIVFQLGCVCDDCKNSMAELKLDPQNENDVKKHDFIVLKRFQETVFEYVKKRKPDALVFFNGSWAPDGGYDFEYCIERRAEYLTHVEIESIPSGIWGYNHFPLFANFHNRKNTQIIGMNGKFHNAWGDFGSLRNIEALEYECFRMIANGAKCCIGDQMHPRAYLDKAVYKRIGQVFSQIEQREPWCTASEKIAEIAVLTANRPLESGNEADEGALRILMELHHTFDFITCWDDFCKYRLVILPDHVLCDEFLAAKISEYVKNGGKVIFTYKSGMKQDMSGFAVDEMGVEYLGENEYLPSYLLLEEKYFKEDAGYEYAVYEKGLNVKASSGTEIMAETGKPYFNRTYDRFCSHRQFPFDKSTGIPGITKNTNIIYIANPLFTDYIKNGVRIYRNIIKKCIELLYEKPLITSDLPASAEVAARKQENRIIVHIIHYIAERKARTIDIVDTKLPLHNVHLNIRCGEAPKKVYLAPECREIAFDYSDGYVKTTVPEIFGHNMVVLEW